LDSHPEWLQKTAAGHSSELVVARRSESGGYDHVVRLKRDSIRAIALDDEIAKASGSSSLNADTGDTYTLRL
jgi:hypothetical protein